MAYLNFIKRAKVLVILNGLQIWNEYSYEFRQGEEHCYHKMIYSKNSATSNISREKKDIYTGISWDQQKILWKKDVTKKLW